MSIPPVLRGRIGRHAAREWAKLADNLAIKRDIIRAVLSSELLRTEPDQRKFSPQRVRLAWVYGDGDQAALAPTREARPNRRPAKKTDRSGPPQVPAQRRGAATAKAGTGPAR